MHNEFFLFNNTVNKYSDLIFIKDVLDYGFFYESLSIISFFVILFSILTIITRNPIFSVLYLICLFSTISIYLILIGLTFIGLSYLLVYIGAISMLFLFILMLIDIRLSELHVQNNNSVFVSFLLGTIFIYTLNPLFSHLNDKINDIVNYYSSLSNKTYFATYNSWDNNLIEYFDIINLGNNLYINMPILLIITSLVLLLSMVGAIIINIKK